MSTRAAGLPSIGVRCLGQSGFRLDFGGFLIYVDPYLSDSVERLEGPDMARLVPPPLAPAAAADADWVLVTHAHLDHCDPDTLVPIAQASATARFMGPAPACRILRDAGILAERIQPATEAWSSLGPVRVHAVAAAHPRIERDTAGNPLAVGYVMEWQGRRIYHAGDTSEDEEMIAALRRFGGFDAAFLPVNERTFERERRGIVANMSLREAFHLADAIGARSVVPMHWDLFAPNGADAREISVMTEVLEPRFDVLVRPESV